MSLVTRLNDLIDEKLYEEAVQFVKARVKELSSSEMRTVGLLLSTCINISKPALAAELMTALANSPTVPNPTDLRLSITGLLRAGRLDLAYDVATEYLSKGLISDPKFYELFLEGALEAKAHQQALDVLKLVVARNIPKDNLFWVLFTQQSVTKGFIRTYELESCKEVLLLIPEQSSSEMIWNSFYDACLYKRKLHLAIETLSQLVTHSSSVYSCKLWNLLLRKVAATSDIPDSDVTQTMNAVSQFSQIVLDEATMVACLTRVSPTQLLNSDMRQATFDYIKVFKSSMTPFTFSKILALFVEKKAVRESLELMHLLSHEFFGGSLQIKHLDINPDSLKWIVYNQQLLMYALHRNKLMKTMLKKTMETQTDTIDVPMPQETAVESDAKAVVSMLPAERKGSNDSDEDFVFLE